MPSILSTFQAHGPGFVTWAIGAAIGLLLGAGVGALAMARFSIWTNQAHIRSALNCVPSLLAVFSQEGQLMFWNQGYANLLESYGVTASRALTFAGIMGSAADGGLPKPVVDRALGGGLPYYKPLDDIPTPDGRWLQVRMGAAPDGGFIVLMTDITEQTELTRREAEARGLAERASLAKSEFLANMSHEIRTPLNGILGMVQVMRRKVAYPEQADQLEVIDRSGQALLHVLNNVLDLSKIEAGKLELEVGSFDIEETVGLATSAFSLLAEQKEIRFSVTIQPEARGVWSGDSGRLRQVLSNLLSNALKFTTQGSVELRVAADPGGLSFEVADTGVGVPADKLELIFDKFTQADASTTRRFGGTGLGLAICRQFVRLMGSELTAASQEGVGSTFAFTLPLERSAAALPGGGARGAADSHAVADVLRILAAEDNQTNQLILKALLEPLGVDLTIVENGRSAVEAYRSTRFDVILMDIQMPEMNGIDATEAIRALERQTECPRTPIIALTANVMRHQTDSYVAAGMDSVVAKPIELQALADAIEQVLQVPDEDACVSPVRDVA